MKTHSKIGASSMHRWSKCPGSVALSEGIPNESSIYADEGTLAHEHAESLLTTGRWANAPTSPDMEEAVYEYVDYVTQIKEKALHVFIEQKLDLSSIHPGLFGTADCVAYTSGTNELEVIDYKHGAGIAVDVFDNPQLKYYALGALLANSTLKVETIKLTVVQPRCYHPDGTIRSYVFGLHEIFDFKADLIRFAKATEDPNAPLKSGGHCKFCPASPICPEKRMEGQRALERSFADVKTDLKPYEPKEIAQYLALVPKLKAWISDLESFAYSEAVKGVEFPGFKLVQKMARRKWRDETEAISLFDEMAIQPDQYLCAPSLLSPAQVEKAIGGKEIKNLVSTLTVSESNGLTLVDETDKRPAVTKDSLPAAFKHVKTGEQ